MGYSDDGSGTPSRTTRPVSSSVSLAAATHGCSPGSSLPLAHDQSSYFGRCTRATSSCPPRRRQGRVPAAGITEATRASLPDARPRVAPTPCNRPYAGQCSRSSSAPSSVGSAARRPAPSRSAPAGLASPLVVALDELLLQVVERLA